MVRDTLSAGFQKVRQSVRAGPAGLCWLVQTADAW